MEKMYHIYAKDKCIFHSLTEDEFQIRWKELNNMVSIMDTHYNGGDLSYEELTINKKTILESSH